MNSNFTGDMDHEQVKRLAFVGASIRSLVMYPAVLSRKYADLVTMVGVYDINWKRAAFFSAKCGGKFPAYESFEQMLAEARPDMVIIATIDRYHHEYVIKALEAGVEAIVEKPMTIDEEKCLAIMAAERRTGRQVRVVFNYRFTSYAAKLKELVQKGAVGTVFSVHFEWLLDTDHGADYFRRWHSRMANSGGLLVHKSTHHFDLVNWLLEDQPEVVSAFGSRRFYGTNQEQKAPRCLVCPAKTSCPYYFDLTKKLVKNLYLDCEDVDGYIRDGCVFSSKIDIADTLCVNVQYTGGALLSYSLTASSPYEGYKLAINGSAGRMEVDMFDGKIGPYASQERCQIRVYDRSGGMTIHDIPPQKKLHGGGDERFLDRLLRGCGEADDLGQMANAADGVMSVIIGIAANKSIAESRSIRVSELLS